MSAVPRPLGPPLTAKNNENSHIARTNHPINIYFH